MAIALQACGPTYQTLYDYKPPAGAQGRVCVAQCQVSQNHCRTACSAKQEACQSRVRLEARQDYERYVAQETKAGREPRRTPASFERFNACSDTSCRQTCEGDFRVCYSTCGGAVTATTVCTSGCDR
ncbi:hypothetical protein ACM64Y_19905 [Novispirillum sp. DQ9]|uniref:hypothetical protein n=1 Tax=Novispirillum sp. DQ9 TaxID=3398612 RepID=UPI003C7CAB00